MSEKVENKKLIDHLLTGLNGMIPFVVAGGVLMAIGFAFAGADAMTPPAEGIGTIGQVFYKIGNTNTMALMFMIVGGLIAQSIAGTPALLAGMVGGSISAGNGSTFLGAVAAGFLAGYTVKFIVKFIKLPEVLGGVFSILLIPILSTLVVGLTSTYVIGIPVAFIMDTLTGLLVSMQGGSMILLCAVLGAMMPVDLCGPILRVAYFFGIAAVTAAPGVPQTVMAAVIVGGMTPPLGLALACLLQKNMFTKEEREQGKACWVLGASFICEGMIPFAIKDLKRVVPSCVIGSAVGGALTAILHVGATVVHGGLFILPIPGAVKNPLGYIAATVAGAVVTAILISILKKNKEDQEHE